MTPSILPGVLRQIGEIAGMQAAIDLCETFRNCRIYIPKVPFDESHRLVKAVGMDAALLIAGALGGEDHVIPSARPILRAYRARVLRAAGYSTSQIALILDMDRGHVLRLAPLDQHPPGNVDPHALQAALDNAPKRFADLKPAGTAPHRGQPTNAAG